MRNISNHIVEALSDWWGILGWLFFGLTILTPYLASRSEYGVVIVLICAILTMLSWIIDAISQVIPLWMWLIGVIMLGIGILPGGLILIIACWIIYWSKVRE
jgi:hypothetical protein